MKSAADAPPYAATAGQASRSGKLPAPTIPPGESTKRHD